MAPQLTRDLLIMRMAATSLVTLLLVLAGCDQPAPWARREVADAEAAAAARRAPPPAAPLGVSWDGVTFRRAGQPLKAARTWSFADSTEGFTLSGGDMTLRPTGGLVLDITGPDSVLRSPSGLDLDGARYPLVIVRLTRTRAGGPWDGAMFYKTPAHGESEGYSARPAGLPTPRLDQPTILIYDMTHQDRPGDWMTAAIDQIRLDNDDKPGGGFIIHQVALAERPPGMAESAAPNPTPASTPPVR